MDIEAFRTFCLSFSEYTRRNALSGIFKNSRSILVLYIGKKMFCFFDIDKFDHCTLKCDPEAIEELRKHKGIQKLFNLSWKHWVSVALHGTIS
ncbi:MmcQ/YjbR family DNA-binding protein [Myroides odoratimimus]|uniref:MmcQ/YjbR family DNA-binding protein n=1 Tax=Myroides odoratimimus TaxID=76832 RepID=UPI00384C3F4D